MITRFTVEDEQFRAFVAGRVCSLVRYDGYTLVCTGDDYSPPPVPDTVSRQQFELAALATGAAFSAPPGDVLGRNDPDVLALLPDDAAADEFFRIAGAM